MRWLKHSPLHAFPQVSSIIVLVILLSDPWNLHARYIFIHNLKGLQRLGVDCFLLLSHLIVHPKLSILMTHYLFLQLLCQVILLLLLHDLLLLLPFSNHLDTLIDNISIHLVFYLVDHFCLPFCLDHLPMLTCHITLLPIKESFFFLSFPLFFPFTLLSLPLHILNGLFRFTNSLINGNIAHSCLELSHPDMLG